MCGHVTHQINAIDECHHISSLPLPEKHEISVPEGVHLKFFFIWSCSSPQNPVLLSLNCVAGTENNSALSMEDNPAPESFNSSCIKKKKHWTSEYCSRNTIAREAIALEANVAGSCVHRICPEHCFLFLFFGFLTSGQEKR